MVSSDVRIERAWQKCKGWITRFDGTPNETYLPEIAIDLFPRGIETLAGESTDLRVTAISAENAEQAQNVRAESIQDYLVFFQKGVIAGLNVNYTANLTGFPLDLHMVVTLERKRWVNLEIVWWADQAFPDDSDARARFNAILANFIYLQGLFGSPRLYVGPESIDRPGDDASSWMEV